MRQILKSRGMRFIFGANLVSMIGSGMNSAAVIWYILQATHSEVSLGTLIALQTLPSLVLLPFTKLFHTFSLFISRWYNGDFFGRKGVAS